MRLFFLSASLPLRKTHTFTGNTHTTENYPMVKNFTSIEEHAQTPEEFYTLLQQHANQGHALLKGQLTQPLVNESKAGKVDNLTETSFLVFDLDGISQSIPEFIQLLPDKFHGVSYITQYSAGHKLSPKLKAHIFFLLTHPVLPSVLKNFLIDLNLTQFNNDITLQPGNLALNYPVDIQVNNNAVPLFISPPQFVGAADPVTEPRISFTKGSQNTLDYDFLPHGINVQQRIKDKIKTLRNAMGLRAKSPKLETTQSGVEILKNVEATNLCSAPFEERGFIYLPINPKNRHTYFHPVGKPQLIFNFYGEPAVETSKFLPDYWEQINPAQQLQPVNTPQTGKQFLVFRDIKQDTYYNGWATDHDIEVFPVRSKDRIEDFARQNDLVMPDPIPDWIQEFNPTSPITLDFDKKYLNTYRMPSLLKEVLTHPKPITQVPPTIHEILWSATGSDQMCYDHFLNWLAFIAQTRQKTKTAWVLQGIEGTGKGVLFNLILSPIFGHKYCHEKMLGNLNDTFNDWIRECILVFFDETKHHRRDASSRNIPNLLKHIITEPQTSIRAMRTNAYQAPLYNNCLFSSNELDSLYISPTDRRYNVCPPQQKTYQAPENLEELISNELTDFVHYLINFKVNVEAVSTALNNEAKEKLRSNSMGDIENFFHELSHGNFAYFAESYWDTVGLTSGPFVLYKNIIHAWAARWQLRTDDFIYLRRDELLAVFSVLLNINDMTVKRFTRLMTRYGIELTRTRVSPGQSPIKDEIMHIPVIGIKWLNGLEELENIHQHTV